MTSRGPRSGRSAGSARRTAAASRAGGRQRRSPVKAGPPRSRGNRQVNRLLVACLVLLALAALYGAAGLRGPHVRASGPAAGSPGQLAVTSALLGCAGPGSAGGTGGGIAAANTPSTKVGGTATSGRVTLTPAGPRVRRGRGGAQLSSPQAGQLSVVTVQRAPALRPKQAVMPAMAGGAVPTSLARGGLVVAAAGAAAQGLDVEQLGPDGRPTDRCQPPGSDFWFITPGAPKLHIELYLLNVDNGPADATVAVQTDTGQQLGSPDTGIVIPPHSMVVQNLDKLFGKAKAIALNVTTSTGRIVAAVRETTKAAQPGIWLPAAPQPATQLVLPGMPAAPGSRQLFVTVPGSVAAQVKVTAVTPRGSYQPTLGTGVTVLQHQTSGITISSLDGIPGALKITANVPVTAVLEVSGGPAGAPGAFVTGSGPVTEQGVVAASPVGHAGSAGVVLAAPQQAASVRITVALPGVALAQAVAGGATPAGAATQVVRIAAKSATQVRIGRPRGPGFARARLVVIVVTPLPGSGPVYAARVGLAAGTVLTVLPVASSPTVIRLPEVRESLLAILGSR